MIGLDIDVGDGLTLHVERDGSGPPVLLLHGFTGSTVTWDTLRTWLRGRYEIITVDLPGHGRSSIPADPARYALTRTADDLARVLDVLGVDRAAVLGYSMGGRTALRLALAHPDRVAALVLESVSSGIEDADERTTRSTNDEALADSIERDGIEAFVDYWERLPLWNSQRSLPRNARESLRLQRLNNRSTGLANSLRGAGAGVDEPVLSRLRELGMPTLLVAGERDTKYVLLEIQMGRRLHHGRLEQVKDAGHAVHLEQPEAFATLVEHFLLELPATDGRWTL